MAVEYGRAVKKNDLVMVIAGKDKGKRGRVLKVIPKIDRALVVLAPRSWIVVRLRSLVWDCPLSEDNHGGGIRARGQEE